MVIILSNYDGLESQMLHTKFRENWPARSGDGVATILVM